MSTISYLCLMKMLPPLMGRLPLTATRDLSCQLSKGAPSLAGLAPHCRAGPANSLHSILLEYRAVGLHDRTEELQASCRCVPDLLRQVLALREICNGILPTTYSNVKTRMPRPGRDLPTTLCMIGFLEPPAVIEKCLRHLAPWLHRGRAHPQPPSLRRTPLADGAGMAGVPGGSGQPPLTLSRISTFQRPANPSQDSALCWELDSRFPFCLLVGSFLLHVPHNYITSWWGT